jgi:hypothetical protein
MLTFTLINDYKDVPRTRRLLFGGCRDFAPAANLTVHPNTKMTFARDIRDVGIVPCVIVWEKTTGDKKYTLVQEDDA